MTNRKRWLLGIYSLIAGMVVALGYYFLAPLWHVLHGAGVFDKQEMRKYQGSNEENLKAIYTAMMKYHESEGQFPDAAKWMDELKPRIRTNDLTESEAEKKLVFPAYLGQPGKFGYAMNDAAAAKFKKDLNPKTPLIFDSSDLKWDAHGDPKKIPMKGGEAIAVDGTILKL